MATKNNNSKPFKPVSPGSILKDELEARNLQPDKFASLLKLNIKDFEALLNGNLALSKDIANLLEAYLGIPAYFWLSLQDAYEEDCHLLQKKKEEHTHSLFTRFTRNRVAL